MFETVVVPLDGSALAEGALATAVDLCRRMRSRLVLARAHNPPEMAITRAYEWDRETRRREQDYLQNLISCVRERFGVEAESAVLDGHAARGGVGGRGDHPDGAARRAHGRRDDDPSAWPHASRCRQHCRQNHPRRPAICAALTAGASMTIGVKRRACA